MPASASAASARSASSSRTKKSTSCSVGGPPRAHAASPPPSRYGTSASRRAAAASFIASIRSGKLSGGVYGIGSARYPIRRLQSVVGVVDEDDGEDGAHCRRRRHPLLGAAAGAHRGGVSHRGRAGGP